MASACDAVSSAATPTSATRPGPIAPTVMPSPTPARGSPVATQSAWEQLRGRGASGHRLGPRRSPRLRPRRLVRRTGRRRLRGPLRGRLRGRIRRLLCGSIGGRFSRRLRGRPLFFGGRLGGVVATVAGGHSARRRPAVGFIKAGPLEDNGRGHQDPSRRRPTRPAVRTFRGAGLLRRSVPALHLLESVAASRTFVGIPRHARPPRRSIPTATDSGESRSQGFQGSSAAAAPASEPGYGTPLPGPRRPGILGTSTRPWRWSSRSGGGCVFLRRHP